MGAVQSVGLMAEAFAARIYASVSSVEYLHPPLTLAVTSQLMPHRLPIGDARWR